LASSRLSGSAAWRGIVEALARIKLKPATMRFVKGQIFIGPVVFGATDKSFNGKVHARQTL
jgi:hypothetical protein